MKVASKPKFYRVKCDSCASIIDFRYTEINQDSNSKTGSINCLECNYRIPVARLSYENKFTLLDTVKPIYEDNKY